MKTLDGGPTAYVADVDNDVIAVLINPDTDVEDSFDMKPHKNQDPLSSDHLALHLLKCKGCSEFDWSKTSQTIRVVARNGK